MDAGKRACRRREPAGLVRRCARPARAGDGHGRRAAAGIRARISGQRDRAADRRDGVSGAGQSGRFARAGADARAADRQRLDVDDRRERRTVFPAALAVLDDALDDPARDRQRKMDAAGGAAADSAGHGAVRGVHGAGTAARLVSKGRRAQRPPARNHKLTDSATRDILSAEPVTGPRNPGRTERSRFFSCA